jgi:23S rRNA (adenine2503-C2)-methyltransferase
MAELTLLDLPLDALRTRLAELGHPPYRAEQIWHAAYRDLAVSYGEMTTLPIRLRAELEKRLPCGRLAPEATQQSPDRRTRKTLLRLDDGEAIETVSMHYDDRRTVCVSTQVGCALDCRICATGRGGFIRDLSAGEIVGQVLHAAQEFRQEGRRLTNVVYMGMGEPFANYDATLSSIRILNHPRGFNLGARSFTVSTVGIVPGIERFADEGLQVNLAISLHAANDELRDRLLPINRTYPLGPLLRACRDYVSRTNRRITFEVALIDGVNDSPSHAIELAGLLRGLLCHVNLIPFNPVSGLAWKRSSGERVNQFSNVLEKRGIPATIRVSRGVEIQAGCGQLRAEQVDTVG